MHQMSLVVTGLVHVVYEICGFCSDFFFTWIETNLFLFLRIADGGVLRSIGDMVS